MKRIDSIISVAVIIFLLPVLFAAKKVEKKEEKTKIIQSKQAPATKTAKDKQLKKIQNKQSPVSEKAEVAVVKEADTDSTIAEIEQTNITDEQKQKEDIEQAQQENAQSILQIEQEEAQALKQAEIEWQEKMRQLELEKAKEEEAAVKENTAETLTTETRK